MRVVVRLFAVLRERAGRDSVELELEPRSHCRGRAGRAGGAPRAGPAAEPAAGADGRQPRLRLRADPAARRRRARPDPPAQRRLGAARGRGRAAPEPRGRDGGGRATRARARWCRSRASPARWPRSSTRPTSRWRRSGSQRSCRTPSSATGCARRRPSTASATVPLGEPSVIVAASAAHREEAFAGAREIIDRIKSEAPIWKRELRRARRQPAGARHACPRGSRARAERLAARAA